MNEPVRVGIMFSRSGQRLYVNLPSQIATALKTRSAGLHTQGVVCKQLGSDRPTDVYEPQSRTL